MTDEDKILGVAGSDLGECTVVTTGHLVTHGTFCAADSVLDQTYTDCRAHTNTSGVDPLDKRVLVRADDVQEKVGSIIMPDQIKEQDRWAQTRGTLIAVGETAWAEAVDEAHRHQAEFVPPKPGDRIMYAKYGGVSFKGDDGVEYRIMNDEDIVGRLSDG